MEKKTTRRIIGVLVVVALVIILLPLMFNNTETQSPIQTSEAKAPPFPSNEIETARASDTSSLIPPSQSGALISRIVTPSRQQQAPAPVSTLAAAPAPAPVVMAETVTTTTSQTLSQPAPAQNAQAQANDPATFAENTVTGGNQSGNSYTGSANADALSAQNADLGSVGSTDMMSIRPVNELSANTTPNAAAQENVIVIDSDSEGNTTAITRGAAQADLNSAQTAATAPTVRTITTTTTTPAPVATMKKPHVKATVKTSVVSANSSSQANLKKGAWIVQLGSFKSKINAERLTNSLRARGYKAFTRETRGNGQIRVFVGPENQQVAAASLASKLEQEVNLRGIVMSSQSLA